MQARHIIAQGRVAVNGKVVRSPDRWIALRADRITLDGRVLQSRTPVYLAMHKPAGIVTTRSDELGRSTVYDLLPERHRWLFPVGRLDKESSGLLLLTNDTRFGELVTNPSAELPKQYEVRVNRPLLDRDRETLRSGMTLPDGTMVKPALLDRADDPASFALTISEGKNRQIRRMCRALGYEVLSLKRLSIGPIRLGDLPEGSVRPLSGSERAMILGSTSSLEKR